MSTQNSAVARCTSPQRRNALFYGSSLIDAPTSDESNGSFIGLERCTDLPLVQAVIQGA